MPLYSRRPAAAPAETAPLALSSLLTQIRTALHHRFPDSYWVVAEVADLTRPRFVGGHCYLTLTDPAPDGMGVTAQARATLWSQRYQQVVPAFEAQTGQALRPGLKLLLRVQVRFHEQYGLSLDVLALDPSFTVGELARQRILTLQKLDEKGLLARQKTLALALAPQHLAVISSPTAAGFQDFVQQLQEAPYDFALTLFPASMQGDEAPASIRAALDAVRARRGQFQAVVIIRGGGSKTDLLAFDDYGLAAAIGAFALPVLTGIGHERDEAVADLTAHRALKTPTAVAAFLVERLARLEAAFLTYAERITDVARQQLARQQNQLEQAAGRARYAGQRQITAARAALHQRARQAAQGPRQQLRELNQDLSRFRTLLPRAARRALAREQRQLRQRGRSLLKRFLRHHQRRREGLLRTRYELEMATQKLLHRQELRLLRTELKGGPGSPPFLRRGRSDAA